VCVCVSATNFSCFLALKLSQAFWACLSIWHKTFAGSFSSHGWHFMQSAHRSLFPAPFYFFLVSLLGVFHALLPPHIKINIRKFIFTYTCIYCPWRMSPANEPRKFSFPFLQLFYVQPSVCKKSTQKFIKFRILFSYLTWQQRKMKFHKNIIHVFSKDQRLTIKKNSNLGKIFY